MSSSEQSNDRSEKPEEEEEEVEKRQNQVAPTTASSATTTSEFASRYVDGGRRENSVQIRTSRSVPNNCTDEQRAFIRNFNEQVVDLVRQFRRRFPYRQTIRWSVEYGDNNQYSLHILVKPSQSTNSR